MPSQQPYRIECIIEGCDKEGPAAMTKLDYIVSLATTLAKRKGWSTDKKISGMVCPSCQEVRRKQAQPCTLSGRQRFMRLRANKRKDNR